MLRYCSLDYDCRSIWITAQRHALVSARERGATSFPEGWDNYIMRGILHHFREWPELATLSLYETGIYDDDIAMMGPLDGLRVLDVSCNEVSSASVTEITSKYKQLRTLDISYTSIQELPGISSLESLSILRLAGVNISASSLSDVAMLPRLEEIDLSHTRVTAMHLSALKDTRTLLVIEMRGVHLSNEAMSQIPAIATIETIVLDDSQC